MINSYIDAEMIRVPLLFALGHTEPGKVKKESCRVKY